MADLADYLDLTVSHAREQFRSLLVRRPVPGRQVTFLPVETLLCLAASFLVNHRHFGGSTAHQAPEPVQSLARLFSRPPSSVLAKMANLDGSRSHGARWDVLAGAMLREDPARFSAIYRVLLHAARAEGIGPARLPDFLGLEQGGELARSARRNSTFPCSKRPCATRSARTVAQACGRSWRPSGSSWRRSGSASTYSPARYWPTAGTCVSFAGCGPHRSAAPGCSWPGISSRGRTAHPASASIPATAWLLVRRTMWPSILACSQSTGDCVFMLPAPWPTLQGPIRSPGSTTGGRRCGR